MSSTDQNALITRWDTFLGKIKERHLEVLNQSKDPMNEVISGLEYDSIVVHNVIQGLKQQSYTSLYLKAEEAWEKMEAEMEKLNIPYDNIDQQRDKHHNLREWMDDNFERFTIKTFADAARKIQDNIMKNVDPDQIHNCVQCGGQLDVETFSFQAINVKCATCGSVNTYQPDGRVRALEGVYSLLADENAMEEKIKSDKHIKHKADYFKKYYGFIMEKLPSRKEYYERI